MRALIGLVAIAAVSPTTTVPARVIARWPAEEARQGVAVDAHHVYAIGNNVIGKYDKRTGRRIARWEGDKALFPHINSCVVDGSELVCAASNYPAVPMASSIEFFDRLTLAHRRTQVLYPLGGSLTWLERRGGSWWAGVANYDGRGGEPGRDHRFTFLLQLDPMFRPVASWRFPDAVLERFAPSSCSGGSWGEDGLLYVSGHDKPELYVLRLPRAGATLELVATIPVATEGQAIGWDRRAPRTIWSVGRSVREMVASKVPNVRAEQQ